MTRSPLIGVLSCGALTLCLSVPLLAQARSGPRYDYLIRGGTVIDGTGAPRVAADLALVGDRISRVVPPGTIPASQAKDVIDASGLIVAPGFIDLHAHVNTIPGHPEPENFLWQGITTSLASLHSQDLPWPLDAYASKLRMAPNIGFFAGHNWIRNRVVGMAARPATPAELSHMRALVDSAMRQGAMGLSTGLEYVPGAYGSTEELIELAKVAAAHGGTYFTHMRDEGAGVLRSVAEVIRISREAGLPAEINHLKAAGAAQFGLVQRALAMLDSARRAGVEVNADAYPYAAFSTISDVMFPAWALAGGPADFEARTRDPSTRARLEREMTDLFPQQAGAGPSSIVFREIAAAPSFAGRTLADLARQRGLPETVAVVVPLLIELQLKGGFLAVFHAMDPNDVDAAIKDPNVAIESDGDLVEFGKGVPHPRSYGTFPRVIAEWVRNRHLLSLEAAVRKMTSLPAQRAGLFDRGEVREGAFADLALFDPDTFADRATFDQPHQYAVGLRHLLVNGVPVIRDGVMTHALPGRVLHRDGVTADSARLWTRGEVAARIADIYKIHTPEGIQVNEPVPVNGSTQWISIRGLNRANPVLLLLHGGPGAPMMPSSWAYQKPWEDYFTVVNWDQRGVGKSFSAADSARLGNGFSNEQLVNDAEAIVEHLREKLGRRKLIVMGFSWGSIIGPFLVRRHPDWYAAYVGVGQSADDGEAALHRRLLQLAAAARNDTALAELKAIGPYPPTAKDSSIEKLLVTRKWARFFDGGWYGKRDFKLWFSMQDWSPEYTADEAANFLPAMAWAGRHVISGDPNVWQGQPTDLKVPVVILQGRFDLHTPWDAARRYFNSIRAPRKRFITFERSAHFPMFEEPGRFLVTLVQVVRPLAGPPTVFSRLP